MPAAAFADRRVVRGMRVRVPKFERSELWPSFPDDPRDPHAWESFWQAVLDQAPSEPRGAEQAGPAEDPADRLWRSLQGFYEEPLDILRMDLADHRYRGHLAVWDTLGVRRVLCAGNGISVLPYMFSHRGLEVTAADVSNAATDFVRSHPPEEKLFLRFFSLGLSLPEPGAAVDSAAGRQRAEGNALRAPRLAQLREAVRTAHRPGGSHRFMASDLFAYEPGAASFEAAVLQNVAEHFSLTDRRVLAERLYHWLVPGGVLVVESQFLSLLDRAGRIQEGVEEAFEGAGFLFHLKEAYLWQREQTRAGWWQVPKAVRLSGRNRRAQIQEEFHRRAQAAREADLAQVRAGRRMVVFQYGR
jgi:hypothetical protein